MQPYLSGSRFQVFGVRKRSPFPPRVSKATGWTMWDETNPAYLVRFLSSAASATHRPSFLATWRFESANLCTQVESHIRGLPLAHGTRARPSDRLPSVRNSPVGSKVEGIFAWIIDLWITWFPIECRACTERLFLQTRECLPRVSTISPQEHLCVVHTGAPSQNPIAILNYSSSSCRQRARDGSAFNQSPAPGHISPCKRVFSSGFLSKNWLA